MSAGPRADLIGSAAAVLVPATSANLGPGFDSLGLALDLADEVRVTVVGGSGARVLVEGAGAGEVPGGEHHLVVRAMRAALVAGGVPQPLGLELHCTNRVPHGRGLGSSAAAVVAGVLLGRALALAATGRGLDDDADDADDAALALATTFEGHPDNAAAALLGGATIAWTQPDGPRAVGIVVHADVVPLVLLPHGRLATARARSVLPAVVPHEDAVANVARAALLVHALGRRPDLLLDATADRLHQQQRRAAMPATIELVERLRTEGAAAVVSGAGPAVLVLTTSSDAASVSAVAQTLAGPGWQLLTPGLRRHPTRTH